MTTGSSGGKTQRRLSCSSSWEKITPHSILSFSHRLWLAQIKAGLCSKLFPRLSGWITKLMKKLVSQRSSRKQEESVSLETMQKIVVLLQKYGDTTFLPIDLNNRILSSSGVTLLLKTTTSFWKISVTSQTDASNSWLRVSEENCQHMKGTEQLKMRNSFKQFMPDSKNSFNWWKLWKSRMPLELQWHSQVSATHTCKIQLLGLSPKQT